MFSTIQQRVWEAGQSLAGDGMLLRLRNASIALVGAVAAVGLGLTLFISQLGFPSVFSGPIPGSPERSGVVHDAIALSHDPGAVSSSPAVRRAAAASPNARARRHRQGEQRNGSAGPEGSRQTAVAPGTQSGPAAQHPASAAPLPEPVPQPAVPSPKPAATASPPTPNAGGQSTGTADVKSASNTAAAVKAASDGSGKSGISPAGTAGDKNGGRTTSTTAKSTASPSEKASKDKSVAAATPPTSAAPPAASPEKEVAPAANPAAAKEAADSGQ